MFVRIKRSGSGEAAREYLQIVESVRDGRAVRQRILATLGRRDEIVADGTLDGLLQSMAKFSERLRVVEKIRSGGVQAHAARAWGPSLVFDRLWRQQRLPELIRDFSSGRRFEFDVERACFALALQRLCAPGSDLAGSAWLRTVECPGFDAIELHHLYRAVGFLADARDGLEKQLFLGDRDLFSEPLDLVFIDTTSTFIYRSDETELRERGYSRDRMPDQPQVIIALAVDKRGWPIAWEILPGSTADKAAFVEMIAKLRQRFAIRNVIVVADRGMISKETMKLLADDANAPFGFILGCRMRQQKEVSDEVLTRAGRYRKVAENLEVKEVRIDGRRYVVCRNPIEARKDAEARAAIVEKLEDVIARGPKSVVRNKGYARFLRVEPDAVSVDRDAIERDARYDGKFVLRTSTDLPTDEVALAYKSLWRVERAFRETKSTLDVRPVYHHRDDTTIGHIVGCFLALRLEVDLQRRLDERGCALSWPDVMRDLHELRAVDATVDEQRYLLRTDLRPGASAALAAAGVRAPSVLTRLGPAPPAPASDPEAAEM